MTINNINNPKLISLKEYKESTFSKEDLEEMRKEYPKKRKQWREEALKEVADQIRKTREKAGFTQEELANALHTSRVNIVQIESGNRNITLETLQKIGRIMGKELVIRYR